MIKRICEIDSFSAENDAAFCDCGPRRAGLGTWAHLPVRDAERVDAICSRSQAPGGALALQAHHAGELTARSEQIGRRTLLDHTTLSEHHDLVGREHRAHAMGDHNDRLARQQIATGAVKLDPVKASPLGTRGSRG